MNKQITTKQTIVFILVIPIAVFDSMQSVYGQTAYSFPYGKNDRLWLDVCLPILE
jgi:hypothetical protein